MSAIMALTLSSCGERNHTANLPSEDAPASITPYSPEETANADNNSSNSSENGSIGNQGGADVADAVDDVADALSTGTNWADHFSPYSIEYAGVLPQKIEDRLKFRPRTDVSEKEYKDNNLDGDLELRNKYANSGEFYSSIRALKFAYNDALSNEEQMALQREWFDGIPEAPHPFDVNDYPYTLRYNDTVIQADNVYDYAYKLGDFVESLGGFSEMFELTDMYSADGNCDLSYLAFGEEYKISFIYAITLFFDQSDHTVSDGLIEFRVGKPLDHALDSQFRGTPDDLVFEIMDKPVFGTPGNDVLDFFLDHYSMPEFMVETRKLAYVNDERIYAYKLVNDMCEYGMQNHVEPNGDSWTVDLDHMDVNSFILRLTGEYKEDIITSGQRLVDECFTR